MWDYDVCICSTKTDANWGERLGKSIKDYSLPQNVEIPDKTLGHNKIVFDIEGNDFEEKTAQLLDRCRYLLIICSPDTKDSQPIYERLVYFESKRGKTNIIAVIVDGEPIDAFPPVFIEEKMVQRILPDGTIEERAETIEPVASDLRAQNPRQEKQLLRYETVRIVASVLGLVPDMLEQRHNTRRRRRIAAIAITAAVIFLSVGGIFTFFGVRAIAEGQIAKRQSEESLAVVQRIVFELPEEFRDNDEALVYVYETIFNAMQALYKTDSVNLNKINVDEILAPQASDGADVLLRKARILRIYGSERARESYELAADALELSEEDELLFLILNGLFFGYTDGYGAYVLEPSGALNRGDILVKLGGQTISGTSELAAIISETVTGQELNATVLRLGSAAGFTEHTISIAPEDLALLRLVLI